MRKLAIALAICSMFVATFLVTPAVNASGFGVCSQDRFDVRPRMGHAKVVQKVSALIRCVEGRWSVPGGASKAISVADCESSLWPWVGQESSHVGLYQHISSDWTSRARAGLRARWFTDNAWNRVTGSWRGGKLARANVIVSLRMAHNGGWGPWSCA